MGPAAARSDPKGGTGVKRQLIIATIALSATGLAACGSSEDQAKSAGEQVGTQLAELQTRVMARAAEFDLEGIEAGLKSAQDALPETAFHQLEAGLIELQSKVTAAQNHPEGLDAASRDGLTTFTNVSGDDAALNAFKQGVKKGYADASQ